MYNDPTKKSFAVKHHTLHAVTSGNRKGSGTSAGRITA